MSVLTIIMFPMSIICGALAAVCIFLQIKEHLYDDGKRNVLWWAYVLVGFPFIVGFGYIALIMAIWLKCISCFR